MGGGGRMKRIIKELDRKINALIVSEAHERFDGNHHEANSLCGLIADLVEIKNRVRGLK